MSFHQEQFHKKDKVRASKKQERRTAKRHGGQPTLASGRLGHTRGDVRVDKAKLLIENKTTTGKSISIRADWLQKIEKAAMSHGLTPAIEIELGGQHWLIFPEWALET